MLLGYLNSFTIIRGLDYHYHSVDNLLIFPLFHVLLFSAGGPSKTSRWLAFLTEFRFCGKCVEAPQGVVGKTSSTLWPLCYCSSVRGFGRCRQTTLDWNSSRYSTILKQTRPLTSNPALQNVLIKLVGTEEEVIVAKEIQKALKAASVNHRVGAPYQVPYPAPRASRDGRPLVCYWCGLEGHVMRNCRRRNRGGYSRGRGQGARY